MWENQSMVTLAPSPLHEQLLSLPAWEQQLDNTLRRLAPLFARPEVRQQAKRYVQGLLRLVERKNGWQRAEHLDRLTPTAYNIAWTVPAETRMPFATN
jgi:hypothetical protein